LPALEPRLNHPRCQPLDEAHQFPEIAAQFFGTGGRGLNVTVPHKAAAAAFATELTPRAARAGAGSFPSFLSIFGRLRTKS
jgi:shikimate dehydrogenase